MTTESSPLLRAPAAYPASQNADRSGWLIAFGIFDVLVGLSLWLLAAFTVFTVLTAAGNPQLRGQIVSIVPVILLYGGMGTAWIVLGVASAMKRNWARLSLLVIGWAWLVFGVLITLAFALFGSALFQQSARQVPNADPTIWKFALIFTVIFCVIFMVALPLVFVFFYSRPSVKATCTAHVSGYQPSSRPVFLNVLAAWFFFVAASLAWSLITTRRLPVFGVMLPHILSVAYVVASFFVYFFGGWAFLKRRTAGFWVMLTYSVFSLLSMIVTLFVFRDVREMLRLMEFTPAEMEGVEKMAGFMAVFGVFTILLQISLIGVIWWSKRYFTPSQAGTQFSASLPVVSESKSV
jgi:hypothetical protein